MKEIIITANEKDECSLIFGDEDITWADAVLMLCSTIEFLANNTINMVSEKYIEDNKEAKVDEVVKSITEDISDQLNYCFSNILNKLCPKDPDLSLSETAIATCENIIIHHAAEHNMDIKDALKEVESILSQYIYAAKPIGENGDNMACAKKKKGCKGSKGGC